MPKAFGSILVVVGIVLCAGVIFIGYRLTQVAKVASVVIRRPGLRRTAPTVGRGDTVPASRQNLAPLATVSVSSVDASNQFSEGVADGIADSRDWVSNRETAGAWIKVEWAEPVTVSEVELFDLPSPAENVLAGTLVFDDGGTVEVPPLPPDGTPWRTVFTPRPVRSMMFRIDRVQGRSAGMAEIMVYGPIQ